MPGMGGQKCLEKILEIDPSQNIVIASGYMQNGSMNKALRAGAKGCIEKPYDLGPMLTKIRDVLDEK